jgi:glycosyltransferase involved in cell wall biosynthesis
VCPSGKCIIFTAIFGYLPNARAANFLIEEVFPRLAATGENRQLLLVGSMPTRQMIAAAMNNKQILVTGAVADVRPYIAAASAMVVPLFEGGGTRYKILEAFAAKVPVISTAMGAQGLQVKPGEHLLIAESAAEFVDAMKQLWTDQRLVNKLTEKGLALVKENYSWDVTARTIKKAINELGPMSS